MELLIVFILSKSLQNLCLSLAGFRLQHEAHFVGCLRIPPE